jgi:hypothetical protein
VREVSLAGFFEAHLGSQGAGSGEPGRGGRAAALFVRHQRAQGFAEILSFDVESSNSSGYDPMIGNVTLTFGGECCVLDLGPRARHDDRARLRSRHPILCHPPPETGGVRASKPSSTR